MQNEGENQRKEMSVLDRSEPRYCYFFNWMQNKLNGGQANKKPNAVPAANQTKFEEPGKEKFSGWSNGLLAIGTFGNRDRREDEEIQRAAQTAETDSHEILQEDHEQCSSPDDLTEFTPEEVGQLQKELTRLLKRKPTSTAATKATPLEGSEVAADLPLDRFLNCPSSLEVDRTISNRFSVNSDYRDEEDIDRTIRVIIGRCKEVCMENKKAAIGKKSISFLLKKMFVCRSGFAPAPSLRDTLQESRMEKLLRTMLSKKMYPQNASRASSMKRILVDRHTQRGEKEDETQDKIQEVCKWVKTDSEFIVLDLD
ncbi:uncharacterized protein LOC113767835 [Coffea eugenioides]|uniref:uncharacterized protein LOC113767835 n=1 Tax=Coffea eugenioides TaxID=49369 RepID=UPI000F60D903|nr:uncharacterized protein LOC113767835 [Coffea eugenioides]